MSTQKRNMLKRRTKNLFLTLLILFAAGWVVSYYVGIVSESRAESGLYAQQVSEPFVHPDISEIVAEKPFPAEGQYCLACHQGIEPTRPIGSRMMQQILEKGASLGDPNGCVICHGGTPSELHNKNKAHSGVPKGSLLAAFTPVPAALQVNDNTCGQCHADHVYNVRLSMMNSDAGKMKAMAWSFGIGTENRDHIYANSTLVDTDGNKPRFGTEQYIEYMKEMAAAFPGQYPSELKEIPSVTAEDIKTNPELAAFTYLRNCNACHVSNKGYQDRGHYRGMGCASCHSLYSNEGYYEGGDPEIPKDKTGHVMVHSMQGTRKSSILLNDQRLSGVQVSTCAACHAGGRRIGHSYQGFMPLESSYNKGIFDEKGLPQKPNAGYVFKYMQGDSHRQIEKDGKMVPGLLCQDCHTTIGIHGGGNIDVAALGVIEIECADCHGTPTHYPWELPLGFGDEFGKTLDMKNGRGVAEEPLEVTREFGITYPKEDGYLLSARGNPLGNVVRRGDRVIVHSDGSNNEFELITLKEIAKSKSWNKPVEAKVAMVTTKHIDKLECYACHSTWIPQYYGYKYVIDYRKSSTDWLRSPQLVGADGTTADYHQKYATQPGAPTYGDYSHIRWENAPLGVNGEGRVSPLVGVIQTVSTVIDADGNTVVWNNLAKTEAGYDAIELAPINPHTTSLKSRECTDCHGNLVAAGYGIDGGIYDADPATPRYGDVIDSEGNNVSQFTQVQIAAIKELHGDFMRLVNLDGEQVQTIDTHWPTSIPLTQEQRDLLSRQGSCVACHRDIPNGTIPNAMLTAINKVTKLPFSTPEQHSSLLHSNNLMIAWIKAVGVVALIILAGLIVWGVIERKKVARFWKRFVAFLKNPYKE
jgi:hypothetical protein